MSILMEYDWHCRQNFGLVNLNLHPPKHFIPVTRGSLSLLIYHCDLLYSPQRVYFLLFIEFFFLPLCGGYSIGNGRHWSPLENMTYYQQTVGAVIDRPFPLLVPKP